MRPKITVFTPTYNRAHIIQRLYRSLQSQSYINFEWLVVDDGSTDDTQVLFSRWKNAGDPFQIRYFPKSHEGKCQAINHALRFAQGELFFTVDSDDYLLPDALKTLVHLEASLPHGGNYCGFAGNLGLSESHTPNPLFSAGFYDGTLLSRYDAAAGERAFVFYTAIHRKYLYPHFPGEAFMTEAVAWNRMAGDGYATRYYNDILGVYEYQPDGLTRAGNTLFLQNPRGFGLFLREKAYFQHADFRQILTMWYTFTCDLFDLYSTREIAGFIQAPHPLILLFHHTHKLLHDWRMKL